jgi:hypothetical protein
LFQILYEIAIQPKVMSKKTFVGGQKDKKWHNCFLKSPIHLRILDPKRSWDMKSQIPFHCIFDKWLLEDILALNSQD